VTVPLSSGVMLAHLILIAAKVWEHFVMDLMIQVENFPASPAKIFVPLGGVVAPFALLTPDSRVAIGRVIIAHDSSPLL
jgi:hypothetical protein